MGTYTCEIELRYTKTPEPDTDQEMTTISKSLEMRIKKNAPYLISDNQEFTGSYGQFSDGITVGNLKILDYCFKGSTPSANLTLNIDSDAYDVNKQVSLPADTFDFSIEIPADELNQLSVGTWDICVSIEENENNKSGEEKYCVGKVVVTTPTETKKKKTENKTKSKETERTICLEGIHDRNYISNKIYNDIYKMATVAKLDLGDVTYGMTPAIQGKDCQDAFKAATPAGYSELFTFNLVTNGKATADEKKGSLVLTLPESLQSSNNAFAVLCAEKGGTVKAYPDEDTNISTLTVSNLQFNGYAGAVIYTDTTNDANGGTEGGNGGEKNGKGTTSGVQANSN